MREIKFKVWDTEKNEMNSVEWINIIDKTITFPDGTYFLRFDQVELMQYTGITDINGVPVYEGDILRTLEDENNCNFQVIFKDGCFITDIDNEPLSDWSSNSYIIGNIYENPELIN